MPVNTASRSINLPNEIAEKHDVQFLVHSRLAVKLEELNRLLNDHLHFTKSLAEQGILPISGPFFTEDGKNSGTVFTCFGWTISTRHAASRPKIRSTKVASALTRWNLGCKSSIDRR